MLRKGAFTAKHFDSDPAMSFMLYEEDPVSHKIVSGSMPPSAIRTAAHCLRHHSRLQARNTGFSTCTAGAFTLMLVCTCRQYSICAVSAVRPPIATASCCHVQVCRMISNPKVTSDITRRMAACYGDRKQKEVGICACLQCCRPHLHGPATAVHWQQQSMFPSLCLHSSAAFTDLLPSTVPTCAALHPLNAPSCRLLPGLLAYCCLPSTAAHHVAACLSQAPAG